MRLFSLLVTNRMLCKFFKLAELRLLIFHDSANRNAHPSGYAFLLYNGCFYCQHHQGIRQKDQPIFVYTGNTVKNPGG